MEDQSGALYSLFSLFYTIKEIFKVFCRLIFQLPNTDAAALFIMLSTHGLA